MTLFANSDGHSVNVHVTYGPISIQVKEDVNSARAFWRQLGQILGEPTVVMSTPIGYQGAAQHTATLNCDGHHEPGKCKAAPVELTSGGPLGGPA